MQTGKLPARLLQRVVLSSLGTRRSDVLLGPSIGEDAAVVDFGDEVLVIASDPITGAFSGAGRLAVHVAANDVAATGAEPIGVQPVLLWPPQPGSERAIQTAMEEIAQTAADLGMAVLGGHTEITSRVDEGLIVMTCIGRAPRQRYVATGGGRPGDELFLIGAAGMEGTAILASEHASELKGLPPALLQRAARFADQLSIVKTALLARDAGVSAMHDVTEGGVLGASWELAQAAGLGAEIDEASVPVQPETDVICKELGIDPLRLLGSGALLVATSDEHRLAQAFASQPVQPARIGHLTNPHAPVLVHTAGGASESLDDCPEDDLWRWLRTATTEFS